MATGIQPQRWDDLDEAAITDIIGIGLYGRQALPLGATAPGHVAAEASARKVAQAFSRFFSRARREQAKRLLARMRTQFPAEDDALLKQITREELDRETEFQRRMLIRVGRDLKIAYRIQDPTQRHTRVRSIVERERRYIIAREQAMAERAMGRVELEALKRTSPEGAYWSLSPNVKKHTLDCVALSGQFWPHKVLTALHPPLHHGCACYLVPYREAVANGLMAPDQIPEPKDALRRARDLYNRAKALEHAAEPEEIEAYYELIEAPWRARYPKGTLKGGQFRPKDRYDPGIRRSIHHALRDLLPHRPSTPAGRREAKHGDWQWIAGHKTFVPHHRLFSRRFGGHVYSSPPDSGFVYRDGQPYKGTHGEDFHSLAMPQGRLDTGTINRIDSYMQALSSPTASVPTVGNERLINHTWKDWSEFVDESNGLAASLGAAFRAPFQSGQITIERGLYDHSAITDWEGNTHFGRQVRPTVESEALRQSTSPGKLGSYGQTEALVNTYRVQAHEMTHRVNPMSPQVFSSFGAPLEEGMTEDIAHVLMRVNMKRHGRGDLIDWVDAHPEANAVRGTYVGYRDAIGKLFDRMTVPQGDRIAIEMHLKYQVPPANWQTELAALSKRYNPEHPLNEHQIDEWFARATIDKAPKGQPGDRFDPGTLPDTDEDRLYKAGVGDHLPDDQRAALARYSTTDTALSAADHQALTNLVMSHPLPFDVTVSRKAVAGELDGLKPGDEVTEDRFISTSVGEAWGIGVTENNGTLKLHAPAGTPGYYNPNSYGTESEVIFAPGMRYKVDTVSERDGKPYVEATVTPSMRADTDTLPDAPTIVSAFEGFEHNGLVTKIDLDDTKAINDNARPGTFVVSGQIMRGSKAVGNFERSFTVDDGKLVVHHERLNLDPSERDHGFATAFNRHAEDAYREMGVDRVELDATMLGGYAWARAGYEFAFSPEVTVRRLLAARLARDWTKDVPKDRLEAAHELERAITAGDFTHPAEVAGWGRRFSWTADHRIDFTGIDNTTYSIPKGTKLWPGKLFMIGSSWTGVKSLNALNEALDAQSVRDAFQAHDVRVPPDAIWGDEDEAFWDSLDQLAEAYAERRHPRDRHGRWKRSAMDFGPDVEKAATALGQGDRIRLDQPKEVGTLVNDLYERVQDAKRHGANAPNYDLCAVSVRGTNLFCAQSKGIPRAQMPQLGGVPIPGSKAAAMVPPGAFADLTADFVDTLRQRGVKVTDEAERADVLKATQDQLNGAKVASMVNVLEHGGTLLGSDDRLVVSRDNYILDGHHRWAAQVGYEAVTGKPVVLPVARIDMSIGDLITAANAYAADMGLASVGVGVFGKITEAFDGHTGPFGPSSYDEHKHRRGRDGKWIDNPGGAVKAAETVKEVVEPKSWESPPPPVGKKGESVGGRGYSSDAAYGTNTALGRVGEQAFVNIVGGSILHPEGHGEQSPLDVKYDGYGFEVKAVSRKTLGYKATPKPYEIDQKEAFAKELGVQGALAIVVVDSEHGTAHVYYRDGLKGGRLSQNTGWNFLGSGPLPKVEEAYVEAQHPRDTLGRWAHKGTHTWWHAAPQERRDAIETGGLMPRAAGVEPNFATIVDDAHSVYLWPTEHEAVDYAKRLSADRNTSDLAPHAGEGKPFDVYEVDIPHHDIAPDHAAFYSEVLLPYLHNRWLTKRGYGHPLGGEVADFLSTTVGGTSVKDFVDSHLNLMPGYGVDDPERLFTTVDDRARDALPMLAEMPSGLRSELGRRMSEHGYGIMTAAVPAERVRRAGTFRADPGTGKRNKRSALSEDYAEHLHPRDRRGRWMRVGHHVTPTHKVEGDYVGAEFHDAWRSDPRVKAGTIGRPKTYSPEIAGIETPQDAERVFKAMGIVADFQLDESVKVPSADYFRQIAQATKDMTERFPSLREGEYKLGNVRFARSTDPEPIRDTNTWATTGPNPAANGHTAWPNPVGFSPNGGMKYAFDEGPTTITINPWDFDAALSDHITNDYGAPPGKTAYGLMTHEIGHAVEVASGLEMSRGSGYRYGSVEKEMLKRVGLTPSVVDGFSHYGTSNAFEAWAETFAVLNTPGAIDVLPPELQTTLRKAQKEINALWPTRLM